MKYDNSELSCRASDGSREVRLYVDRDSSTTSRDAIPAYVAEFCRKLGERHVTSYRVKR